MVRAQSMPRIAGRASGLRRTGSFRAKPYESHGRMGTVVRPGGAHIARACPAPCQRPARESARGMRNGCAQCSCLAPLTAHRSRSCTACSSITRRSSAFSLQLEATHRARAPQWLRANSTDRNMNMRIDHILASGCSRTPIGCLVFTMLANITQCLPNL
jgi:hypothetical protein